MNIAQINGDRGRLIGINLDELSGPDFAKIKGRLKNVRDHVLFDSLRFLGATVWTPQTHNLFQTAKGQTTTLANSVLQYVKDDSDTNLQGQGGQLPSGDFFTVQSIMVKVAVAENEFTTPLSNTVTMNPTAVAQAVVLASSTPSNAGSASTAVIAITENTVLRFLVDDTRLYENGTTDYFPQGFGYSGWSGGSQGGMAQNGGVLPRMLARPRHLRELQRFVIEIVNTKTLTIPTSCRLKVGLWGALYVPVG